MGCICSKPNDIVIEPKCTFISLPRDIHSTILSYFNRFDLLDISHVNKYLYELLSEDNNIVWANIDCIHERRGNLLPIPNKKLYMTARSLFVQGTRRSLGTIRPHRSDGWIDIPKSNIFPLTRREGSSFSFDAWFAVSDEGVSRYIMGGCLLGGQTTYAGANLFPEHSRAFVSVNTSLELSCSVLHEIKPLVGLQSNIWYHVALVCSPAERQEEHGIIRYDQFVYLDGLLIDTQTGYLYNEWKNISHMQIGSAYISPRDRAPPIQYFNGWYGFRGALDIFRGWNNVALSETEVQHLAKGSSLTSQRPTFVLSASNIRFSLEIQFRVRKILCSRPWEEIFLQKNASTQSTVSKRYKTRQSSSLSA